MANEFYTHNGYPQTGSTAISAPMRAEFEALDRAFAKLPGLAGNANKFVTVNASANGLAVLPFPIILSGAFTTVGASTITLSAPAISSVTFPTSGTLARVEDLPGAQTTGTLSLSCTTPGNLALVSPNSKYGYVKVGRMVAIYGVMAATLTHTTASGSVFVTGLPVAPEAVTGGQSISVINESNTNITTLRGSVGAIDSTSTMRIILNRDGNTTSDMLITEITTGDFFRVYFSGIYRSTT